MLHTMNRKDTGRFLEWSLFPADEDRLPRKNPHRQPQHDHIEYYEKSGQQKKLEQREQYNTEDLDNDQPDDGKYYHYCDVLGRL